MTEVDLLCFPWFKRPHGRRPDVAFFKLDRLPVLPDKAATVAPNFVAEVISPSDNARYLERKVEEYLKAGVELVWIINPDTRTVRVHRGDDGSGRIYHPQETATLEPVLTGFSVKINDLFPAEMLIDESAADGAGIMSGGLFWLCMRHCGSHAHPSGFGRTGIQR